MRCGMIWIMEQVGCMGVMIDEELRLKRRGSRCGMKSREAVGCMQGIRCWMEKREAVGCLGRRNIRDKIKKACCIEGQKKWDNII